MTKPTKKKLGRCEICGKRFVCGPHVSPKIKKTCSPEHARLREQQWMREYDKKRKELGINHAYYWKNRDRILERVKKYREAHPEQRRLIRKNEVKKRQKLIEYAREMLKLTGVTL